MTSNTPETALMQAFYAAFAKKDWAGMSACYHPSISFKDEVFNLKGKQVEAMWRMLCETGKDMRIEASRFSFEKSVGRAHWDAHYSFSATGRKVLNRIDATFKFKDGKIIEHRDRFNFWRWAMQALGFKGLLLGWMPRLQQIIQRRATANLDKFIQAHPEYAAAGETAGQNAAG